MAGAERIEERNEEGSDRILTSIDYRYQQPQRGRGKK
jgi:hypothetical protein